MLNPTRIGAERLPLSGITVVGLEQAVSAPFATRQLADLGARVIKVERPGSGDFAREYDDKVNGLSSVFLWLNRGKESIALDLKTSEGRQLFDSLLSGADVLVHNLSTGAARRAELDAALMRERFPNLIFCAISGYGVDGPMRDAKAYDLLVQGETGLLSLTGSESEMAKVGISIADIAAGMYAYSGILAALTHRERTGEVTSLDVSLFDSLAEWLAYPLYYTRYGGEPPGRVGLDHPTIAPYGRFETRDGESLLLAVQNESEWKRFCRIVMNDPDLSGDERFASNTRRVEYRSELDHTISRRCSELTRKQLVLLLEKANVAHGRINGIEQLANHPQITQRDRWITTDTPFGKVETLRPPVVPSVGRIEYGRVPALDEHDDLWTRGDRGWKTKEKE